MGKKARNLRNPTTVDDACQHVAELITHAIKVVGESHHLMADVKLASDKDWDNDSCVILKHQFNGKWQDMGLGISPMIEHRAMGLGKKQMPFVQYYVHHEICYPGVYRYPDGSGEPDSYDITDDLVTERPCDAAKKIVLLYFEWEIDQMFNSLGEEDMANDEVEFYDDMASFAEDCS